MIFLMNGIIRKAVTVSSFFSKISGQRLVNQLSISRISVRIWVSIGLCSFVLLGILWRFGRHVLSE